MQWEASYSMSTEVTPELCVLWGFFKKEIDFFNKVSLILLLGLLLLLLLRISKHELVELNILLKVTFSKENYGLWSQSNSISFTETVLKNH